MHIHIFNACLAVGWIMALIGGVLLNVGLGLAAGGLLLIVLAFVSARLGGIYAPKPVGDEGG